MRTYSATPSPSFGCLRFVRNNVYPIGCTYGYQKSCGIHVSVKATVTSILAAARAYNSPPSPIIPRLLDNRMLAPVRLSTDPSTLFGDGPPETRKVSSSAGVSSPSENLVRKYSSHAFRGAAEALSRLCLALCSPPAINPLEAGRIHCLIYATDLTCCACLADSNAIFRYPRVPDSRTLPERKADFTPVGMATVASPKERNLFKISLR